MSIFCVISPDSRGLLNRLAISDEHSDHRWVMFDQDIQTPKGLEEVKQWLLELNPAYVLVELKAFNENSCENEQSLSSFLEEKSIPANFLLPQSLDWHYVKAITASANLGIHELSVDRLRGQDLVNSIEGHITVYHMPPANRSYSAN